MKLEIPVWERSIKHVKQAIQRSLGIVVLDRVDEQPEVNAIAFVRDP